MLSKLDELHLNAQNCHHPVNSLFYFAGSVKKRVFNNAFPCF